MSPGNRLRDSLNAAKTAQELVVSSQLSALPLAAEAARLIEQETKNESRLGVIRRSSFKKASFTRFAGG
jgi:hypothetical protein